MPSIEEIKSNPNYVSVLDKGWVGLVDHMGSDSSIVRAARVSYGSGTKSVREDRGLLRYLMRHHHSSPFEMCDVIVHIKCPIFVMRQLVRHRTHSANEYSGRYSVMTDEFYVPDVQQINPQSIANKQGRAGSVSPADALVVQQLMQNANSTSYALYEHLLGLSGQDNSAMSEEFPGIARELARTVLPLSNYTELYWKQNLKNLMHMMRLRMDPHAQWEIQEFAKAIYSLIQPLYPLSIEAFEDYENQALTLSRMEKNLLKTLVDHKNLSSGSAPYNRVITPAMYLNQMIEKNGFKTFANDQGMSERELNEFIDTWSLAA